MSSALAYRPGLGTFSDINADSEDFEKSPRSLHLLPILAPSQPPLPFSRHIPFETGSVLDAPPAGYNPEHLAYKGTVYHNAHRVRDNYRDGSELTSFARGYDGHFLGRPRSLPLSPPSSLNNRGDMLDESFPRFPTYKTIHTDDATIKLGDDIRRHCFNCGATDTETTTWRRSKLSLGKMVCNKCGLFERSHAIPRPKTFPRRRRSRPPSMYQGLDAPSDRDVDGRHHYNDCPAIMPFIGPPLQALCPRTYGEAASRDTSWMTHNMPNASSAPSRVSPRYTDTPEPTISHANLQLPLSCPPQQPPSLPHLGHCCNCQPL